MTAALQPRRRALYRGLAAFAALIALAIPVASRAQLSVSVTVAPPALPVYEQPPLPAPGYLWVPGYWAYGPNGYFWVPGTWVEPPGPDLVWTPGYWAWSGGAYLWTAGYWGPTVGFYGGINYGYGYPGRGYYGGEWRNHQFFYNSAVDNVRGVNVTNVYTKTVVNNVTVNNVSYNGGRGGVTLRPTAQEQAAARGPHQGPTSAQTEHVDGARAQRDLLASVNHGAPPIAATAKPNSFSGHGVVSARGAERQAAAAPAPGQHPNEHATHVAQATGPERAAPERPEATHPTPPPAAPRPEAARPPPSEHETHAAAGPHSAPRPQEQRPQQQPRAAESTARHEPPRKPEEHGGG